MAQFVDGEAGVQRRRGRPRREGPAPKQGNVVRKGIAALEQFCSEQNPNSKVKQQSPRTVLQQGSAYEKTVIPISSRKVLPQATEDV